MTGPLGSTALNSSSGATPRKVAYFYDDDIGYYAYPVGHPMKPHRIRLAHNLIMHYNLYRQMEVYVSVPRPYLATHLGAIVRIYRCLKLTSRLFNDSVRNPPPRWK